MNVGELKKALENLPDDMPVILQKDAEGNGFSPISGADPNAVYVAKNEITGDVYDLTWSAEDADMTPDEWLGLKQDNPQVLVLYPMN